jgi:hypothetical protein
MTQDEWLSAVLADAPPLSAAQAAALRPIWRPVIPHMATAPAPARAGAAHDTGDTERINDERAAV